MDAIVLRFDAESLDRVRYLERIEWVLTLATLTVFLLEEELKSTHDKLALTNTELLPTQQKLIRTTEVGKKESGRLTPAQEIGLYRMTQEALYNAVKHAHAQRIDVNFEHNSGEIKLSVRVNGQGFGEKKPTTGAVGLLVHNGIGNMKT